METAETFPHTWLQMASGKGLDILNPRVEDVDFNDIAIHLANTNRYTGACRVNVAQHSVLVAYLMPPGTEIYGLLHDAHEAILGDDSTPKKAALRAISPEGAAALDTLKSRWDLVIWEAARVAPPSEVVRAEIKRADTMTMAIERREAMAPPADETTRLAWAWLPDPHAHITLNMAPTPDECQQSFTICLSQLIWGQVSGEIVAS